MSPLLQRFPSPRRDGRPLVLAHRGASADAPENTLAAFAEAVRQGADGVELDVMACGSGELVVCHDEWLDRLAGEHLEVAATPLGRLRELDVGSHFGPGFAAERVPLLGEVLDALPRGMVVNVELKCETVGDGGAAAALARELAARGDSHRFVVSSFNPLSLARARWSARSRPAGMLVEASQRLWAREAAAVAMAASGLHPEHTLCTAHRLARWRRLGWAVYAWTVDAPEDVRRCAALGVDALITNRPAATRQLLAGAEGALPGSR